MEDRRTGLWTLEEALALDRRQVREAYRSYVNPGYVTLLGLVDFDKTYVRAEGARIWDAQGNAYDDFMGGVGSLNQGHNHPKILAAVERVKGMPTVPWGALSALAATLAHNLAQLLPGELSRCFFCQSGTEAVEGALKTARAATGRRRFAYAEGSFHGKTLAQLSVTGKAKYQDPFRPLLPECVGVPYGDLARLEEVLAPRDVAAVILEPIQGEGGIIVPPSGYLKEAERLCRKHGTLFILDEVQTGFGRTGFLFALENDGLEPDVVCLAKSLGGGVVPIGAFVTTPRIWDKVYGGMDRALLHTSTFSGNTWAAAAAIAAIEVVLEEDLPGRAQRLGAKLIAGLQRIKARHAVIREVRGRGLFIGVEFEQPAKGVLDRLTGGQLNRLAHEYLASLMAAELLNRHRVLTAYTINNPNVIRLEPPLVVDEEQVDHVLESFAEILERNKGFVGLALSGLRNVLGAQIRREE